MSRLSALLLAPLLLVTAGCERGYFSATGQLRSTGGSQGAFSATPRACTRDSFLGSAEGLPVAGAAGPVPDVSVLTFLWFDAPTERPDIARNTGPEFPTRLEIGRRGTEPYADLHTRHLPGGTMIESQDCKVFTLDVQEGRATVAGGRPVLHGSVQLDCMAAGRHITADVRFQNCSW